MQLITVKIVSDNPAHGGFIEINETDYDADTMTLYDGEGPAPVAAPHVATADATDQQGAQTVGTLAADASGGAFGAGWGQPGGGTETAASAPETGAETVAAGEGADTVAGAAGNDTVKSGKAK